MMDNEEQVAEIKPTLKLKEYFLRNTWIFAIPIVLFILLLFSKEKIYSSLSNAEIRTDGLTTVVGILLFLIAGIIYLYITVDMYRKNKGKKFVFFQTYMHYVNEFDDKRIEELSYENITGIDERKNMIDRIYKTTSIHITKAVEYEKGMFVPFIKQSEANDVIKQIQELTELKF